MTGVAAQMCGNREQVESLGYRVLPDGTLLDETGQPFSKLGARKAVLNDLSPAATFIASNYNSPSKPEEFETAARTLLERFEDRYGWMYRTRHKNGTGTDTGRIQYVVWSDVFRCNHCQ